MANSLIQLGFDYSIFFDSKISKNILASHIKLSGYQKTTSLHGGVQSLNEILVSICALVGENIRSIQVADFWENHMYKLKYCLVDEKTYDIWHEEHIYDWCDEGEISFEDVMEKQVATILITLSRKP